MDIQISLRANETAIQRLIDLPNKKEENYFHSICRRLIRAVQDVSRH